MIYQHISLLVKIHTVLNIDMFKKCLLYNYKNVSSHRSKIMWREEAICQGHIILIERKKLRLKREVDFYMCLFCRDFGWTWSFISDMFRLASISVGSNPTHSMIFCLYSSRMVNHMYHDILAYASDFHRNL
jgi:hypothetical protein